MILANYAQENRNTYRMSGVAFTNPLARFRPTLFPNFYCGDHVVSGETDKSAFNNGYSGSSAWHQAPKAGGLGSVNAIRGAGALAGAGAMGVNGEAALTGAGDLTGTGALVVSLVAAITGGGSVSAANIVGVAAALAALSGGGGMAAAMTAKANAEAALSGAGDVDATITALGAMAAEIVVTGTGLSTANVADAVWGALATANNTAGTMGEKLNDAGGAGNPWNTAIEGAFTAGELLRLVSAALAGKVSGAAGLTITFRDVNDTADRIVATVDADGNRSVVTLDPS